MARKKQQEEPMTKRQKRLFHLNYEYMWAKLDTTHYYAKNKAASIDAHKERNCKAGDLLPSYATCSACFRPDMEPSRQTVKKIVDFYNANLRPTVDSFRFLNEDLSLTDAMRTRLSLEHDRRVLGVYYGYYPATSDPGKIHGAVLKLYEEERVIKAVMVTGILSDEELFGQPLKELFRHKLVNKQHFDNYYWAQEELNQKCYFYEGSVEVSNRSILIQFHGGEEYERKLVLTLNTKEFPNDPNREYDGGLAFVLATSDIAPDARVYQMGLIAETRNVRSLQDKQVAKLLKLPGSGKSRADVRLTAYADKEWYETVVLAPAETEAQRT